VIVRTVTPRLERVLPDEQTKRCALPCKVVLLGARCPRRSSEHRVTSSGHIYSVPTRVAPSVRTATLPRSTRRQDECWVRRGFLAFRTAVGVVFIAHGYNHIFGGGKIAGTARWFDSLGVRPGILHAWFASLTELGAGILLVIGLATPLACAGVIGTMLVAWITNHRKNGFFVFRPGEGYEYVMVLAFAAVGLGGVGAGKWSADHVIRWFDPPGWVGLLFALIAGAGGAAGLLAASWRPRS
jgi:putative oxidoreductase